MAPPSTSSILKYMAEALPSYTQEDTITYLCYVNEVIAVFSHACMIANGFQLIGLNDPQVTEEECIRLAPRLSTRWNSPKWKSANSGTDFNAFNFIYTHKKSSSNYLLKIDRFKINPEIQGVVVGDERVSKFEVTPLHFVNDALLPLRIVHNPDGNEVRSGLDDRIKEIFVSPSKIQDLASYFQLSIIEKIVPNQIKADHIHHDSVSLIKNVRSSSADVSTSFDPGTGTQPHPPLNPYLGSQTGALLPLDISSRPFRQGEFPPPGFDDEYDLLRPAPQNPPIPNRSPFNIGYDDLHPPGLGPHDPLRGTFVGGGMSGMHPTFNDPLFEIVGQGRRDDRRPGVPEGARYDPLGPGDGPWRGGRPPNPFGGFGRGDFL